MADHGMYDIVARSAARGKRVQQFNWAERDDVTQDTPPLVAVRLLVSKASSFGHTVGPEERCLAVWDCSVAFHRAPLDETLSSSRRKACAAMDSCGFGGPRKASLALGGVVAEELVASPRPLRGSGCRAHVRASTIKISMWL